VMPPVSRTNSGMSFPDPAESPSSFTLPKPGATPPTPAKRRQWNAAAEITQAFRRQSTPIIDFHAEADVFEAAIDAGLEAGAGLTSTHSHSLERYTPRNRDRWSLTPDLPASRPVSPSALSDGGGEHRESKQPSRPESAVRSRKGSLGSVGEAENTPRHESKWRSDLRTGSKDASGIETRVRPPLGTRAPAAPAAAAATPTPTPSLEAQFLASVRGAITGSNTPSSCSSGFYNRKGHLVPAMAPTLSSLVGPSNETFGGGGSAPLRRGTAPLSARNPDPRSSRRIHEASHLTRPSSEGAQGRYHVHWADSPVEAPSFGPVPPKAETVINVTVNPRRVHPGLQRPQTVPETGSGARKSASVGRSEAAAREAFSRLATPRAPGLSERSRKKALARDRDLAHRKKVAAALGQVADAKLEEKSGHTFGDTWKTAGQDGYASALIHAAVRCREVLHNAGIPAPVEIVTGANGEQQLVFGSKGQQKQERVDDEANRGPELVRLHLACALLQELCQVSSPLQDTLRFLHAEFGRCLFDNFNAEEDPTRQMPFFVKSLQLQAELQTADEEVATARELNKEWKAEREALQSKLSDAVATATALSIRLREKETSDSDIVAERDQLRIEVVQLQQLSAIRAEELRDLDKELLALQAEKHICDKELLALQQAEKHSGGSCRYL